MILQYAGEEAETVRAMFLRLYDESKEVTGRILRFQSDAQELCERLSPGYVHYQRPMAITAYLWLKYPQNMKCINTVSVRRRQNILKIRISR